ncbi:MAG TPA: DegT/DnrJ/EryC1/StrS family aminotransferase, partial [Pirellulaceae bacterium]
GLITTSDPDLARRLKRLRTHGMEPRYVHHEVGLNSRLDAIQAAVLHAKLPYLPEWNTARGVHAERYASLIRQAGLDSVISLPRELPGHCHTWNQYTIRVPDGRRDELRAELTLRRIGTEIYYPIPLHRQKCFAQLPGSRVDLPVTEAATREVLSLPLFPRITIEEQEYVVRAIAEFFDP